MPIIVSVIAALTAGSLVLLCLVGDYPWEWLIMNPFTGAVGGYIASVLLTWTRESRNAASHSRPKTGSQPAD